MSIFNIRDAVLGFASGAVGLIGAKVALVAKLSVFDAVAVSLVVAFIVAGFIGSIIDRDVMKKIDLLDSKVDALSKKAKEEAQKKIDKVESKE